MNGFETHTKKREKNKIKTIEPFHRGRCVIQAGRLCEISIYAPFCSFITGQLQVKRLPHNS